MTLFKKILLAMLLLSLVPLLVSSAILFSNHLVCIVLFDTRFGGTAGAR